MRLKGQMNMKIVLNKFVNQKMIFRRSLFISILLNCHPSFQRYFIIAKVLTFYMEKEFLGRYLNYL